MADYIVSDTSLTAVADAIRAKTGGNSQLEFPTDFVSEIGGITGGIALDDFLDKSEPSGDIVISATTINNKANLQNCNNITSATITTNVTIPTGFFNSCLYMTNLFAPLATCSGNSYIAQYCRRLETIVIGSTNGSSYALAQVLQSGVTALTKIDILNSSTIGSRTFYGDRSLTTIILRGDEMYALNNVDAFLDCPFKSNGTGGTIYIPKVLYDELGTGSDLDYKAATNWATVDGYGTITWAQIEGSQYEHYYADGTSIPS